MKKLLYICLFLQVGLLEAADSGDQSSFEHTFERYLLSDPLDLYLLDDDLAGALISSAHKGYECTFRVIMDDKRFGKICSEDLAEALIFSVYFGHENIVKMIIDDTRFGEICSEDLGLALQCSVFFGHENIVKMIMDNSRFGEISSEKLGQTLKLSVANDHAKITKSLMESSKIGQLKYKQLKATLKLALKGSLEVNCLLRRNNITEMLEDYYQKYADPSQTKKLILGK